MTAAPKHRLAPLQRLMLRDSLGVDGAGRHVEQVEIVFARGMDGERVIAAWQETVSATEALRIAFDTETEEMARAQSAACPRVEILQPDSWQDWLDADRMRPLLMPDEVPWRAVFWPLAGRFVWTFHHALLDGRSIARVVRGFLARIAGETADDPPLAKWHEPVPATVALAADIFRDAFANLEPAPFNFTPETSEAGRAVRCLGKDFIVRLESVATAMNVTTATLLTWAWGQALAHAASADAVMVEQLRAGAPQHGAAGFTMNTLPVLIQRADVAGVEKSLLDFRAWLVALREIETVSATDFEPGIFPNMDRQGTSVIMVEHGTLRQMIGTVAVGKWVESLLLREGKSETLLATAHILPDLRLEVEGPGRQDLLARWVGVLENLILPRNPA